MISPHLLCYFRDVRTTNQTYAEFRFNFFHKEPKEMCFYHLEFIK